jgi:hypothetical protein
MSGTVTVASKMETSVLMQGPHGTTGGMEISQTIVGQRDPSAVNGWGLTYDVDSALFNQWMVAHPQFTPFITDATQEQLDANGDPLQTYGLENGFEPAPPIDPLLPPVNVDVPYVWQEEQRMRCTMGNWTNVPTHYDYQWMQDDTLPIGPNGDTLPLLASNDGHTISCVVTASNASGATEAPPSNSVLYTAPVEATSALLISGDFSDQDVLDLLALFNNNSLFPLGFDIVVDGLTLKLARVFGTVASADDICAGINADLGAYLTASVSAAAPWQFLIHSNTTGITSTISYASAPSTAAQAGSVAALMASMGFRNGDAFARPTQDLSISMRLRQSVGAITVQGIDGTP